MKVFVNNEEMTIFNGAKVLDVMRAYFSKNNIKLPCKLPIVTDGYGNTIAPDGQLSEGNHLYYENSKKTP